MPFDIELYQKAKQESLEVKSADPASAQLIQGVFATESPQLLTNQHQRYAHIKSVKPESRLVKVIDRVYDQ